MILGILYYVCIKLKQTKIMIYKQIPSFHFNLGSIKNPFSFLRFTFGMKANESLIDYSSLRAVIVKK